MAITVTRPSVISKINHPIGKYVGRYQTYRFNPIDHKVPGDPLETKFIVRTFAELNVHPGYCDWNKIMPYSEPVISAMDKVDGETIKAAYPAGPKNMPITYLNPLYIGNQLFKVAASFYLMMEPIKISLLGLASVPATFSATFLYLSLNALRNIAADLISKHRFYPEEWLKHLFHIKIGKLTTSLLVTGFAFPFLTLTQTVIHTLTGGSGMEWLAIPLSITLIDGLINYWTRKMRGFSNQVANLDMLRPLMGSLFASSLFYLAGAGELNSFKYLLIRKFGCEVWSGFVEARDKRMEKLRERKADLQNVFKLDAYCLPDPEAMAAISYVHLIGVKSLAKDTFSECVIKNGDMPNIELGILKGVHRAMTDDERIEKTIRFIFPTEKWKPYADAMRARFIKNRKTYFDWLKKHNHLFYSIVIPPPAPSHPTPVNKAKEQIIHIKLDPRSDPDGSEKSPLQRIGIRSFGDSALAFSKLQPSALEWALPMLKGCGIEVMAFGIDACLSKAILLQIAQKLTGIPGRKLVVLKADGEAAKVSVHPLADGAEVKNIDGDLIIRNPIA
ncbi:MAG TPA: hypothetical protein VMD02_01185 [Candidatus Omnitrophota bacterium]|nr:hypothetical protein [Candidatus Omnitrophota bacterium]